MWPFKKKEPERDFVEEGIAKLEAFRKVGETFNYLGRTCIVTRHWEYWQGLGVIPNLQFDYADDFGKLHSASARLEELPGLINQQMPNE